MQAGGLGRAGRVGTTRRPQKAPEERVSSFRSGCGTWVQQTSLLNFLGEERVAQAVELSQNSANLNVAWVVLALPYTVLCSWRLTRHPLTSNS